jgi:HAD superfamily hydrolase (TIGR01509 family)
MPVDAFIFDFDGLILDTESPLFDAWQEIFSQNGVVLPFEKYALCVGADFNVFDPACYLEEITKIAWDRQSLHSAAYARSNQLLELKAIQAGVTELLQFANTHGIKLAVASSSDFNWVSSNLQRLSLLDCFDVIRTAEDVSRVKPDPELYLSAAAALEVAPENCIVFEDSYHGISAALSAGMKCCVVPNQVTRLMDFSQAHLILPSLNAIPPDIAISLLDGKPTIPSGKKIS